MAERINSIERLRSTVEDNIEKGLIDVEWKTVLYTYLDRDKGHHRTIFEIPFRLKNLGNIS
jgi:hypothetical protein